MNCRGVVVAAGVAVMETVTAFAVAAALTAAEMTTAAFALAGTSTEITATCASKGRTKLARGASGSAG